LAYYLALANLGNSSRAWPEPWNSSPSQIF